MSYQYEGPQLETVRTRQIAALRNVINLNQPVTNTMVSEPVWKILVMDKLGQDVISPLLPVKVLRELGVTLHLLVGSKREALTDVPAVYFVSPTDENVDLLCEDLRRGMYDSFYINMISPLSRARLENLASAAVQGGTIGQVQKVVDQYLNFISLEDDLFVLRRYSENSPMSYYAINDPSTSDDQMAALIESVADGLFSVCATMGIVPIIRCPKDNAAEQVAKRLDQKLRDNLRDARNNLFTVESVRAGQLNASRPLLLIADRSADLATMLHHTWTYQALIHDVLELDQNRVTITEKAKRKEYDMSSGGSDKLWTKHKGSAFPLVAEAIQEDLEAYRSSEDEIKRLKHAMGMEGNEADAAMTSLLTDTTAKLGSTVTSLPQLLEAKRLIDLHTNVATTLLDQIKQRKLDVLFELEQKLLQHSPLEMPLLQLLGDLSNPEDILRVILINYLCQDSVSEAELEEQLKFLRERNVDESAIRFVKKMRSVSQLGKSPPLEEHHGAGTKTINMFNKLLSHSSRFVMEGVKNLVPKKHNLPLTMMVDSLVTPPSSSTVGINQMMGATQTNESDELCYLDPKVMHALSRDTSTVARARQPPPQDVILFVIGGGNYVEYQNLVDYGKLKNLQRVTYGCTELVNARQFTDQLTRLGRALQ
ncbi:unnamed protein product [Cylicocyclus nassatus]|uniref:Uncharacterized protein n=1 Tax=Cylicocyclus nassatus TaxID=53992 RepID=A0AA36M644_CYLNA|nr:unnamed protein product [Cylicocyclus nassatus]